MWGEIQFIRHLKVLSRNLKHKKASKANIIHNDSLLVLDYFQMLFFLSC